MNLTAQISNRRVKTIPYRHSGTEKIAEGRVSLACVLSPSPVKKKSEKGPLLRFFLRRAVADQGEWPCRPRPSLRGLAKKPNLFTVSNNFITSPPSPAIHPILFSSLNPPLGSPILGGPGVGSGFSPALEKFRCAFFFAALEAGLRG